jgi:hypothetical protein
VRGDERGQTTLELALCLPVIAVLLAGVVETGVVVSDQARLLHAARDAARVAVVDPDPAAARTAAEDAGLQPLDLSVSPEPRYRVPGHPLTVSLTYSPAARIPMIGSLFAGLQMHASATMRIEDP